MKYSKRLTAVILSIMMILTMMPAMAFAEGEEAGQEAVSGEAVETEAVAEDGQAAEEEAVTEDAEEAEEEPEEAVTEETVTEDPEEAVIEDAEEAVTEDAAVEDEATVDEEVPEEAVTEEDQDVPEFGTAEVDLDLSFDADDLEGADQEDQEKSFFYSDEESADTVRPLSIKGDRLTGVDKKYYDAYKSILSKVGSAKKSVTSKKKVALSKVLGKRTFTAKQLGVSQVGYVSNGSWHVSAAAQKKIQKLLEPKDFGRVIQCLISDYSSKSYWVDWYANKNFVEWNVYYNYDYDSITFLSSDYMIFELPVASDFAVNSYKVSISKIIAAKTAKENAKSIVKYFNTNKPTAPGYSYYDTDVNRLYYYARRVVELTDYDYAAAEMTSNIPAGPWGIMYVFDGNTSTKVVCAGYARAFKYLCDISKFQSNWIDCQIVTGPTDLADPQNSSHMWCLVRMNDGYNYVVDPTWMDNGGSSVNRNYFLRGDPNGTSKQYTVYTNLRGYDDRTLAAYAANERKISTNSRYVSGESKKLTLRKSYIKRVKAGKGSMKVIFHKVTKPFRSVYVDGYQIQYSRRKDFKGSTTVKVQVKGYNKTAKTIKKLKRGKKYYVRIRTYAKLGQKTYYSAWSKKASVKIK